MRILVTGSTGLIGLHLIAELKKNDSVKISVLNRTKGRHSAEQDIVEYDYNDLYMLDFKNFDAIVQLAFGRAGKGALEVANSVMSFNQLVFYAKKNEHLKFINISSQEVYGNIIGGRIENYNVKPISIYGFAKLLTEMKLSESRKESNWNFTNIRLAGVVSNETNDRMINRMILSAIRDGTIVVNGSDKRFSFIEVRDVARAVVSMIYSDLHWADIYNLNNGMGSTLLEIAVTIKNEVDMEFNKDVSIIINENDDLFDASMDNTSFCTDFSWSAEFKLKEIVQSIIQYNKH